MASRRITGRVVAFLVVAFLLLAAVHLLWQGVEEGPAEDAAPALRVSTVKIKGQDADVLLDDKEPAAPDAREALERRELERQLRRLQSGDATERRDAAYWLVFTADESCAAPLTAGLKDADVKVAERCAEALTRLWRSSHSAAAESLFSHGLAAYEAGRPDRALEMFTDAAQLDDGIPELYRLRAEILLADSRPSQALADCDRAIAVEQSQFQAHYVAALCYLEMGDREKALKSVAKALDIYPHFEQAQALAGEIQSRQEEAALR